MRSRLLLTLVLAALAGGGCGSLTGDTTAYVQAVNRAQATLSRQFAALEADAPAVSTAAQDDALLLRYERAVARAVGSLEKADPPPVVAALHRRLVAEVQAYGTTLEQVRQRLQTSDARDALAARERLRTSTARVSARIDAIIAAINAALKAGG